MSTRSTQLVILRNVRYIIYHRRLLRYRPHEVRFFDL